MASKKITFLCAAIAMTAVVHGAKVRSIRLNQDDAQRYMVSKVYKLKYQRACDLTPFVEGAVKRYNVNSNVQRLSYTAGKSEYLVVSTGQDMIPYVDDMIKKMDRPGKKDASGSLVQGTGISRFVYFPKHRTSESMGRIIRNNLIADTGAAYVDLAVSMVYWKSSKSKGDQILRWINELDRPVPQVQLVMKVYEVRDSDLRELGIDYVAWKNGPGLDLFGLGMQSLSINGLEEIVNFATTGGGFDILTSSLGGFGGMFFAPQFDFSFVKIMEQNGKARIATSGCLTMVNNPNGAYSLTFTPDFQNIVKSDNDKTTVDSSTSSTYTLGVNGPIICYKTAGRKVFESSDGRLYDEEQESKVDGTIMFNYNLDISSPVEVNNLGTQLTANAIFDSNLTLDVGEERVLATWDKVTEIDQDTGMPFLTNIPVAKYLFGTEDKIKTSSRYIVTVRAEWIQADAKMAGWAGKLLSANQIIEQMPNVKQVLDYQPKAVTDKKMEKASEAATPLKEVK